MLNDLEIARLEREYKNSGEILFHILKIKWAPSYKTLKKFCEETYSALVGRYREFEKTQEYVFTREILTATSCSGKNLAFTVGAGFTHNEISSTHGIGWELQRLLDSQKINPKQFNLRLLVVGRRANGEDGEKEHLPILDKAVGF